MKERELHIWEKGVKHSTGKMRELLALEGIDEEEDEKDGKM